MSNRTKLLIGFFFLLIALALGAWQGSVMYAHLINVKTLNTEAGNLRKTQANLLDQHEDIKFKITEERVESSTELSSVFPTKEEITALNRQFDQFATENDFENNPFFVSDVSYQNASTSENGEYRYIPVSLSVRTSRKNLYKFMDFIQNSGVSESGIRLMSIESLDLNYPAEGQSGFEVRMVLNAYFSRELNG